MRGQERSYVTKDDIYEPAAGSLQGQVFQGGCHHREGAVVEDEINDPLKNLQGQVCRDRRSIVTHVGLPGGSSRAVLSSQVHFGCRRGWSILVVKEAGPFL